jgi:hypothetical protein
VNLLVVQLVRGAALNVLADFRFRLAPLDHLLSAAHRLGPEEILIDMAGSSASTPAPRSSCGVRPSILPNQ